MFWKPFARLRYLLRVTFYSVGRFQTGFHGGYHFPFHFLSVCRLVSHCTSLSVVMACVAFTLVFLGVCRLPVSHFWRESLSLVSWCLSYFALHFVFVACVAYKLFSWRVSPSGCFYGVCRLQVVFTACVAFRLFSQRLSPLGCFYGVFRLQLAISGVCLFHSSFMVSFIFYLELVIRGSKA